MKDAGKKGFVIYVHIPPSEISPENRLAEDVTLATAMGLEVIGSEICRLRTTKTPATLMGKGWVERIQQQITSLGIDYVVIDPDLSALQQRNLERQWKCKVLDRTALILEIFSQRARTAAGTLQVQLAKLNYQKSRLVRTWTHLERQRGGFGFLGGPGESQLELDRRLIQEKIIRVKKDLEKVRKTRHLHRQARQRVPYPVVALVGYTNAGKSTLFNALTHAQVMAADILFATLDPTMRKITLPSRREVILSDTVGFISQLPTALRLAFQATLEEIEEADLLLHIRDIASPHTAQQREDVLKVLADMHCEIPLIEVLNKADLLSPDERKSLIQGGTLCVSALTGEGLQTLKEAIDLFFDQKTTCIHVDCTGQGKMRAWLYEHGRVIEEDDTGHLKVRVTSINLGKFQLNFPKASWTLIKDGD